MVPINNVHALEAFAALAQPPAPTAHPAADAEKVAFYAMFGAAEKATGHKPSHYDVWLMARGLMTADGRCAQPVQQPASPHIRAMANAVLKQLDEAYPREDVDLDAVGLLCRVIAGSHVEDAPAAQKGEKL